MEENMQSSSASASPSPSPVITTTHQRLNFQNHCVFCLQLQPPGILTEIIRRNSTTKHHIEDFQPILNYLTGTDPTFNKGKEECMKRGIPVLDNVPPMCGRCYKMMAELNILHKLLLIIQCSIQKQTGVIRDMIKETYPSDNFPNSKRRRFNSRILASALGTYSVQSSRTCEFIRDLHDPMISEGKKQVLYPSRPPLTLMMLEPERIKAALAELTETGLEPPPTNLNRAKSNDSSVSSKKVDVTVIEEIILSDSDDEDPPPPSPTLSSESEKTRKRKASLISQTRPAEVVMIPAPPSSTHSEVKFENENPSEDEEDYNPGQQHQDGDPLQSSEEEEKEEEEEEVEEVFSPKKEEVEVMEVEKEMKEEKANEDEIKEEAETVRVPPKPKKTPSILSNSKKRKRRRKGDPMPIPQQKCDLCKTSYDIPDIPEHLKSHVQDYVTKCLNPTCLLHFSCFYKMETHLKRNKICFNKAKLPESFWKRKCNLCDFTGRNLLSFRNHFKLHENDIQEKNFPCPIPGCNKIYGLKHSVELHLFYHDLRPPPSEQKCFVCEEQIKISEMEAHLKDSHQITDFVSCKHCQLIFRNRKDILTHIHEHRDEDGVACDICNDDEEVKYLRLDTLREHYFHVHNIGELTSYICEHCSLEFSCTAALASHQTFLHADKVQPKNPKGNNKSSNERQVYRCHICPSESTTSSFKSWNALQTHKFDVHGVTLFVCKRCGKKCSSYSSHKKHQLEHAGIVRTFKCEAEGCGKVLRGRKGYHLHLKLMHMSKSGREFKCEICLKGYVTKSSLAEHHQFVHLGMRPYICENCGESFSCSGVLKKHRMIHTGERPFNCPICNQRFRHKEVMKTHILSHEKKGSSFKPNGPMKQVRKRVVITKKNLLNN